MTVCATRNRLPPSRIEFQNLRTARQYVALIFDARAASEIFFHARSDPRVRVRVRVRVYVRVRVRVRVRARVRVIGLRLGLALGTSWNGTSVDEYLGPEDASKNFACGQRPKMMILVIFAQFFSL